MTDFDIIHDRSGSASEKWNKKALKKHFDNENILPFWVADMEFQAPPQVINSLIQRAQNGIFGYEYKLDSLYKAIIKWYATRHQWMLDRTHIRFSRGILNAVSILINLHTEEGDGIIIQPPVFFEFRLLIKDNNRKVVRNPLKLVDDHYQIDFDDLEKKASEPRTKILIICNPHNPVGRVWQKKELERVGEICLKHNVLVISDEIHGDIVFEGYKHTPFASLSNKLAQNSFTCLSPAKTFNIAAVTDGLVIIPSDFYRNLYDNYTRKMLINKTNAFSVVAMESGYTHAEQWLDELLIYLQNNLLFLKEYIRKNIPEIRVIEPEGTFLVWLDFRALGFEAKELENFIKEQAQIALNSGYWFGRQGAGFARMTFACPRKLLENGLSKLNKAVNKLK